MNNNENSFSKVQVENEICVGAFIDTCIKDLSLCLWDRCKLIGRLSDFFHDVKADQASQANNANSESAWDNFIEG